MSKSNDKNNKKLYSEESSESGVNKLLSQYKPLITPLKCNIQDVEKFLVDNLNATKIDFVQLSNAFQTHVLYNINRIIKERKLNAVISNKDILVYVIPQNEDTKDYYLHSYIPISIAKNSLIKSVVEGKICIIMESETEYIESGSAKLFLEAALKLGVSQYDYENNTNELLCYLSRYKMYKEKKY